VKLTGPLERVLRAFLADVSARQYGYDLMKAAGLSSGTLYPMLARLEEQGLVSSEWEPRPDDAGGRPPRKYYQLTGEGARVARIELAEAAAAGRGVGQRGVGQRGVGQRGVGQRGVGQRGAWQGGAWQGKPQRADGSTR
jgi:PadR family transcriptional regulator, regulatory protein PadR